MAEVERRPGLAASWRVWKAILPGRGSAFCPEPDGGLVVTAAITVVSDRGGIRCRSRCPA